MLEKHLTSRNNQEKDRSHKQQPLQNRWDFDWNPFRAERIWTPQDLTDQQLMLLDLQHRAPWTLERVKGSDPRTLRNILIVVWVTIYGMAVLIIKRLFWVLYTFATYVTDICSTVRICYVIVHIPSHCYYSSSVWDSLLKQRGFHGTGFNFFFRLRSLDLGQLSGHCLIACNRSSLFQPNKSVTESKLIFSNVFFFEKKKWEKNNRHLFCNSHNKQSSAGKYGCTILLVPAIPTFCQQTVATCESTSFHDFLTQRC